jgi:uncharacterized protein YwgA
MGSTREDLTIRDAALLALDAAEGKIEGRTAMQKIMYFAAVELGEDFGHQAHYFGPYSRAVENALTTSALGEEVTETIERFPTYASGPDIRKYTYQLTPTGKQEVEAARAEHEDEAEKISRTVEAVRTVVPDLNQNTLSMAAKVDFIVYQENDRIPLAEIPDLAKQLGWEISEAQVRQSVELLQRLGRLTVDG